jgi:hypothetical protein
MTLVDISARESKKNILETKLTSLKQAVRTRILGLPVKTERKRFRETYQHETHMAEDEEQVEQLFVSAGKCQADWYQRLSVQFSPLSCYLTSISLRLKYSLPYSHTKL